MSTTATTVPAGTYGLDNVHSSIGFAVKYNGIASFRSSFATYDAALTDGVLTGTADAASIQVDEPNFKGHLLSGEFFDAENTPTITFKSTDVKVAEDGTAEVTGDLTIRGNTKSVVATGSFNAGPDAFGNERANFEAYSSASAEAPAGESGDQAASGGAGKKGGAKKAPAPQVRGFGTLGDLLAPKKR